MPEQEPLALAGGGLVGQRHAGICLAIKQDWLPGGAVVWGVGSAVAVEVDVVMSRTARTSCPRLAIAVSEFLVRSSLASAVSMPPVWNDRRVRSSQLPSVQAVQNSVSAATTAASLIRKFISSPGS